jgi:predicted RND superfamily exporter protein
VLVELVLGALLGTWVGDCAPCLLEEPLALALSLFMLVVWVLVYQFAELRLREDDLGAAVVGVLFCLGALYLGAENLRQQSVRNWHVPIVVAAAMPVARLTYYAWARISSRRDVTEARRASSAVGGG